MCLTVLILVVRSSVNAIKTEIIILLRLLCFLRDLFIVIVVLRRPRFMVN